MFIKPQIKIENYFLVWDNKSLGINSRGHVNSLTKSRTVKESDSLKIFIRDTIPALEFIMNMFKMDSKNSAFLKKTVIGKGKFSVLHKFNENVSFILQTDSVGQTILYREEKLYLDNFNQIPLSADIDDLGNDNDLLNNNRYNIIIKWKLGELLFDRSNTTSTLN